MNWTPIPAPAEHAQALSALESQAVITPLQTYGLLHLSGEDSASFLQGQLSSDIKSLEDLSAQYSSHSTPKGRMLASFLIFRTAEGYWLQTAADILPASQKRLSMYILRSKTKISDVSPDYALIGIAGPAASQLAAALMPQMPGTDLRLTQHAGKTLIQLSATRYLLVVPTAQAQEAWSTLTASGATPADASLWQLSEIRAGVPWVTAATQEEFVPQMANLDLIGAVSFNKGCYTGQEIIARTQHLGKVKRRMLRVQIDSANASAGQEIFSPEMNGQHSGKVMLAAPGAEGKTEALVVVQLASIEHGLHLGSPEGARLHPLELPYRVE